MKIAVVGSNGRVGSLVVKEALAKGLDVTGFAKGENKNEGISFVQKDVEQLTKEDLQSYDVVVDAIGGWTADTIHNITDAMVKLSSLLSSTKTRLIVVGGAGSLFVNKEHTITVDMGPDFPDSWKPLSAAHGKGLAVLRKSTDLDWLYVSPACNFVAEGERTGKYQLGGEELILNKEGQSTISYADYAAAIVDEILNGKFHKERISLVSE